MAMATMMMKKKKTMAMTSPQASPCWSQKKVGSPTGSQKRLDIWQPSGMRPKAKKK
jgi:hypothetical protein